MPFGQTFELHDLLVIGFLVVLEGVLSIDNALVLGILARRLPKEQQKRALTYGLIGAFGFRFMAIGLASYLMHWQIVKLIGGGYLVWIAVKQFAWPEPKHAAEGGGDENPGAAMRTAGFWPTVLVIELTDIAFAVDSILAAIGLVVGHDAPGTTTANGALHPKFWVVLTGGFLGVILMRFAAVLFIRMLERFPRFESAAYLLVLLIGLKLCVDWVAHRFGFTAYVNFHDARTIAFWLFWGLMAAFFCVGFLPEKRRSGPTPSAEPPGRK